MHPALPQGPFWIILAPFLFQDADYFHTTWHETESEAIEVAEATPEDVVPIMATQTMTPEVSILWAVFDLEGGVVGHRLLTLYPSQEEADQGRRVGETYDQDLSEPICLYVYPSVLRA